MAAAKKPSASKAVVKWDEELAKEAAIAAGIEANTGGGQFFSTKGGILSWQDSPLPNNEMAVILVDAIFENVFYDGQYDPDVPQGPMCFAFSRAEDTLEPHIIVREAGQNQVEDLCSNCEHNEWGTAERGKGKACRNTRRLAMIPAGTFNRDGSLEFFDDADHYSKAEVGFMKLPVTSVKGYASYVKQVAGALKRPPFGVITRVSLVPDAKTQFKVVFEALDKVPDELLGVIKSRKDETATTIDFPYSLGEDEPAPPVKSRGAKKPAAKSATKKPAARGRKY